MSGSAACRKRRAVTTALPAVVLVSVACAMPPLVAVTPQRPEFRPDAREVAELLELPLPHLMDERNHGTCTITRGSLSFQAPCITFQGRHIWGATALILGALLDMIGGSLNEPI